MIHNYEVKRVIIIIQIIKFVVNIFGYYQQKIIAKNLKKNSMIHNYEVKIVKIRRKMVDKQRTIRESRKDDGTASTFCRIKRHCQRSFATAKFVHGTWDSLGGFPSSLEIFDC